MRKAASSDDAMSEDLAEDEDEHVSDAGENPNDEDAIGPQNDAGVFRGDLYGSDYVAEDFPGFESEGMMDMDVDEDLGEGADDEGDEDGWAEDFDQ